jgi:hypothetical protein
MADSIDERVYDPQARQQSYPVSTESLDSPLVALRNRSHAPGDDRYHDGCENNEKDQRFHVRPPKTKKSQSFPRVDVVRDEEERRNLPLFRIPPRLDASGRPQFFPLRN